jgi:hypothetical protein
MGGKTHACGKENDLPTVTEPLSTVLLGTNLTLTEAEEGATGQGENDYMQC